MRIVIAGGTGFLGTALAAHLRAGGHEVVVLSREARRQGEVRWEPGDARAPWWETIDGADGIVNLAGVSLDAGRWTPARKSAIRESRVGATRALVTAMRHVGRAPAVLLNGSAIGIYGPRGDEPVTEATPAGSGFLASVCEDWEREAMAVQDIARVVLVRTGLVLARDGGALPRLAMPFRLFAGGTVGSGRQYWSWIHRDDWVAMVTWALCGEGVYGPLDVTAPQPATNREFARTLGRVLGRPALLPAPAFALRLLLGETADALILSGQRVLPAKAEALGFTFRFPALEPALRAIYAD